MPADTGGVVEIKIIRAKNLVAMDRNGNWLDLVISWKPPDDKWLPLWLVSRSIL